MIDPESLFKNKRILVMGLGLLGRGLGDTIFLVRAGAQVTVTDLKTAEELKPSLEKLAGMPIKLKLGGHDESDFKNVDMVLRNADVPRSSPFLKIAVDAGVPVEMDESLFCRHFHGRIVGITGTRGKTTTTMLIFRILARCGRTHLAGNIKDHATLPLLSIARPEDTVVLELSSWQLQGFHDSRISPHASVFTNIYPDHLNRYNGMEDYIADKKAVYLYQEGDDFCVFNGNQTEANTWSAEAPARSLFFDSDDVPQHWKPKLPGLHNLQNIAAALKLTNELGTPMDVIQAEVENFSGIEHRLELLGTWKGIDFINDSTSTTPTAGCAALDSVSASRILLIAGGASKNLDLTEFAQKAARKAHYIALLQGSATESLHRLMVQHGGKERILGVFDSMDGAVEALMKHAATGDAVLLSPGCASFGLFRNEFHRGETFIEIIKDILKGAPKNS